VNRAAQEGECSVALPQSGLVPKQPNDGFVRIGGAVVFHLDVLKSPLPKGDASGGTPGANPKKQMLLDLDDLW
jgi:hypothetical protein